MLERNATRKKEQSREEEDG